MKMLLTAIGAFSLVIVGVSVYFYVTMTKPAYTPGALSSRQDVKEFTTPPSQASTEENYFRVDEKTNLHYFKEGQGQPVLVIHGGPGIPIIQPWEGLRAIKGYQFYYYHQRGCGYSTRPLTGLARVTITRT